MAKSARIELRVNQDLKARVEALAAERGQTLTVFAERALEAALAESPHLQAIERIVKTVEVGGTAVVGRPPVPTRAAPGPAFNRVKTLKR